MDHPRRPDPLKSAGMQAETVGAAGAFLAGMVSFASPCVLPLVPAYLSFIGGGTFAEMTQPHRSLQYTVVLLYRSAAFVAGFVAIFVLLGASATELGQGLIDRIGLLEKAAGVVIIVFGLHYIGVLKVAFLQRDVRFHLNRVPAGPVGAVIVGLAFGFGWTPCVGPVLATILTLAAVQRSVGHGMLLLFLYGIGLGVPFMIAAVATEPFVRAAASMRRCMQGFTVASGLLMIATGAAIITGSLPDLGGWLLRTFPALGRIG